MIVTSFRRKIRWAACTAAAALAACTTSSAQEAPAAKPALWKLADEDTTVYLFGTIHLLPEGVNWRTDTLEKAIRSSDTLVLELPGDEDPMAAAQLIGKLGFSPGLPPLSERVPPDKRDALAKALATASIPAEMQNSMETWTAALAILTTSFKDLGLDPNLGAERSLQATYKEQGKKFGALETAEEQMGFFDTLSEEAQRLVLVSALDDPENARAQFKQMLDAWVRGDVDAIAKTFDDETALSPELREALMKDRNERWAERIGGMLDEPGTVMVAVGAGHLAGADSVQTMLEAKGLKVERVQ
ncbi:TraB/GumN family protein [Allosphingosinicella flava]|uniref:TraB/GumN family protein n=1 Tax=Allosphingosinicella flava TaxID=2771430 RepID=UPI001CF7D65E|nr:TraB/GumN family protein [Sphingosinicella flava]